MNYLLISNPDDRRATLVARLMASHKAMRRRLDLTILTQNAERPVFNSPSGGVHLVICDESRANAEWMRQLAGDVRVIWLSDRGPNTARVPWLDRVDLVLKKSELQISSMDELLLFTAAFQGPQPGLEGVATLEPSIFDSQLRLETWVQRYLNWGIRWIELRSDFLNAAQLARAAELIPENRLLWSVRESAHAATIQNLWERHRGAVDWPLAPGTPKCWVTPRFISLRQRAPSQSVQDVLAAFPRAIDEGTQLHAEFRIDSLDELLELEKWRRDFPIARVINPVSTCGRWKWIRLLRGIDHPLSYLSETDSAHFDEPDRPSLLLWARRRRLQKRERKRFGQVLFAGEISLHQGEPATETTAADLNSAATAGTLAAHDEFFARFAAPLLEVKLHAHELRRCGLQKLSQLGLRWAQLDENLARLEGANTWVCDSATCLWTGKWIDSSEMLSKFASPKALPNSASELWPIHAQQEFWNHLYEEAED